MPPSSPASTPARILRRGVALSLLALLAMPAAVLARSLLWSSIEVEAQLDADGRLHVIERQAMVFDGDWNGGERRFDRRPGQELAFESLTRVEPGGRRVALERGDLSQVDRFDWADGALRWRSRLPTDPVFDKTEMVYELAYTWSKIVRGVGDHRYVLDHDFGFADRPGSIVRFTLDLALDPVWTGPLDAAATPFRQELLSLPPGRGVPVRCELMHSGSEAPTAVLAPIAMPLRLLAFLAAIAGMISISLDFRQHETNRDRFGPSSVPLPPDRAWLEAHLLSLPPEVVGALWDQTVGPPEVAAVIARLVTEGKLASEVASHESRWRSKRILALELLVERAELGSYERKLIDKLFFGGRTKTDTELVRDHYSDRGFDPAKLLREPLERRVRQALGVQDGPDKPSARHVWFLLVGLLFLIALEAVTNGVMAAVLTAFLALTGLAPFLIGLVFAVVYRKKTHGLPARALGFFVPAAVVLAGCGLGAFSADLFGFSIIDFFPSVFGTLAVALCPVLVLSVLAHVAKTRDSADAVRRRRDLATVRQWLRDELAKAEPAIEDDWFPYLLAFGLDRDVDQWFDGFGSAASTSSLGRSGSFGSSTSSGGGWTGGGGAFGGAGASATWAAAATGMAAGVAAPSSSGSSGGGGSSSGGGGGGGW